MADIYYFDYQLILIKMSLCCMWLWISWCWLQSPSPQYQPPWMMPYVTRPQWVNSLTGRLYHCQEQRRFMITSSYQQKPLFWRKWPKFTTAIIGAGEVFSSEFAVWAQCILPPREGQRVDTDQGLGQHTVGWVRGTAHSGLGQGDVLNTQGMNLIT